MRRCACIDIIYSRLTIKGGNMKLTGLARTTGPVDARVREDLDDELARRELALGV
jgi:hypothetical protein